MENKARSKAKFRFNFIDAVLIAVILAAAVLLIYIFSSSSLSLFGSSNEVEIEYTVELRRIRDEFRGENFIRVGDGVTDTVTLYTIGEVTAISYSDNIYTGAADDGAVVQSKYPNHMNIMLTIRAKADISNDEYSIGGYRMAVGKKVALRVPNFCGEGYCTTISEINE